tara:strand:+ start:1116 stop:2279 length:1164 start_codon:yes stop_codon:yes gene_type:complete
MDDFVIIKKEKDTENTFPLIPNDRFVTELNNSIMSGAMICVHGPSGCGKSFMTNQVLKEYSFVDFNMDFLRSKKETLHLLNLIGGTESVILFDDVTVSAPGWSCVVEFLTDCKVTTGPIVFVTREPEKVCVHFENVHSIEMILPSPEIIESYGKKYLNNSHVKILKFWKENIRNFLNSLYCFKKFNLTTSFQDDFFSTKDSIHDLMCIGGRGYERFIGHGIEEHGHTMDLIFSNYKCSTLEDCVTISDSLSRAECWDNIIYNGNWEMLPYYTIDACVIPSKTMGNTLERENLGKGTAWTKHYNMKMRAKQLESFKTRSPHIKFDIESLSFICAMLKNLSIEDGMKMLTENNLLSCDLDLMNHIVMNNKLKGKKFTSLKKQLKALKRN